MTEHCSCFGKLANGFDGPPSTGWKWVSAQRGEAAFSDDAIRFNGQEFRFENVEKLRLYRLKSVLGFVYGRVVQFQHGGEWWNIGLSAWCSGWKSLPEEIEVSTTRLRVGIGGWLYRGAFFGGLGFLVWWTVFAG
ncbi:hypothetical protein [Maricaulis sp.]|uniref:hypothetical protein n=1 Tax=Maricaulis sp. TaxID=1486257 RepID=UPI002B278EF8|nr:hypothetical protein [Maricaulis sp.]